MTFYLSINLHIDDVAILHKIKDTLQIGKVHIYTSTAILQIVKHSELINTLIPVLDYTGLYTTKRFDYKDWAKGVHLKNNVPSSTLNSDRRFLTPKLLDTIRILKTGMNKGRVAQLSLKIPTGLEPMDLIPSINPYWLLGFIEGEGSFSVSRFNNQFLIGQEGFSLPVLLGIQNYISEFPNLFNLTKDSPKPNGRIAYSIKENYAQLTYSNADTLYDYILPFFLRLDYFQTRKAVDFKLWAILLILRKTGIFFLPEGKTLAHIIFQSINNRRYSTAAPSDIKSAVPQALVDSVLSLTPPYDLSNGFLHVQQSQKLAGFLRRTKKDNRLYVYNKDGKEVKGSPFKSTMVASTELKISRHLLTNWIDVPFLYNNEYLIRSTPK